MSIREKYGLTFLPPHDSRSRGWVEVYTVAHINNNLQSIADLHIRECESLIKEIEKAQKGEAYDDFPSFDFANPYIELNFPNVEIEGLVISMEDFKTLLHEWVQFNKNYNPNIL